MTTNFKREARYLIFKIADMQQYLNDDQIEYLYTLGNAIQAKRINDKRKHLEAVVVESDWDVYDKVWSLVEDEEFRDG